MDLAPRSEQSFLALSGVIALGFDVNRCHPGGMSMNLINMAIVASGTASTEMTASSTVATNDMTASVTRRHTQPRFDEENDPALAQMVQPTSARVWYRVKRALTSAAR